MFKWKGSSFTYLFIICKIFTFVEAVFENCDYYQPMENGKTYSIYNTAYPNNYAPGYSCRWTAVSPINTRILLNCTDVQIPQSVNCTQDRLAVSLSGDESLKDAKNYCGYGTLTLTSTSNKIALGLLTVYNSPGGKFYCSVTTTPSPTPCQCGWRQERRIVGGQDTGANEFPSMAALIDKNQIDNKVWCGATIIATTYAVTAAHCMYNKNLADMSLLVGDQNIKQANDTKYAVLYLLQTYIQHEGFDIKTMQNDIGIVKTQKSIVFSIAVGPICLPFYYENYNFDDETLTFLGWGTTEFSGSKSDTLQKANLSVLDNSQCTSNLPLSKNQICTYASGKDACQFDSGGPGIWHDWMMGVDQLVAIISYGSACAGKAPGINTRVTSYLGWIVMKTPEISYCKV